MGREFVIIGQSRAERSRGEKRRVEWGDFKNSCRICGSKKFQPKIIKKFKNIKSTWVECTHCKVQRIYPYPTNNELIYYYNEYLSKRCPGNVNHAERFSNKYKEVVFKEYAYSLLDLGIQNEELLKMKILDFGCANGVFLDYLTKLGVNKKNLFGMDISKGLVNIAREKGYKVFTSLLPLYKYKFDLITLWDVIEHLENPRQTIMDLKKVMQRGTKVLVQTPRIGVLSDIYGEKFQHYLPIEHIYLFPRETLLNLFKEMGFEIIKTGSFGANIPGTKVPKFYKSTFDKLAKITNNGATQLALFEMIK